MDVHLLGEAIFYQDQGPEKRLFKFHGCFVLFQEVLMQIADEFDEDRLGCCAGKLLERQLIEQGFVGCSHLIEEKSLGVANFRESGELITHVLY